MISLLVLLFLLAVNGMLTSLSLLKMLITLYFSNYYIYVLL